MLVCFQENVILVRDLFRDKEANEFIIATIPTVLAVKESARLLKALRKESIPCKRIIVNQAGHCRCFAHLIFVVVDQNIDARANLQITMPKNNRPSFSFEVPLKSQLQGLQNFSLIAHLSMVMVIAALGAMFSIRVRKVVVPCRSLDPEWVRHT